MDLTAAYAPADRSVPMVRLNMISSLDGSATLDGRSGPLGGPADQAMMIRLRMLADAILVGANTVRIEGYQGDLIDEQAKSWRENHGLSEHPRLVMIGRQLGEPTLEAALERVLRQLREDGLTQILCEGGPHLFGALANLDAIDELCLTVGPVLVGPGPGRITAGRAHPLRRMRLIHAIPMDDLVFLRYARVRE